MVPLPIDNELDHTHYARHFIEKYALKHIGGRYPEHSDFITLDLTQQRRSGYCFPDFVAFAVTRSGESKPRQTLCGFELKVPAGISINAVEQACRQKPLLNAAYLILLLPAGVPAEAHLSQVRRAARSHGIGLIRVREWLQGGRHELLEPAQFSAPLDPDGPEIIKSYLPGPERAILHRWMMP